MIIESKVVLDIFIIITLIIIVTIMPVLIYYFLSVSLERVAKRLNTENVLLAYIPIGNFILMANMVNMPIAPIFLGIIGFVLILFEWYNIINLSIENIKTFPLDYSIFFIGLILLIIFFLNFITWISRICKINNQPSARVVVLVLLIILGVIPKYGYIALIICLGWYMIIWYYLGWPEGMTKHLK